MKHYIIIVLILFFNEQLFCQWIQTNGPNAGNVITLFNSGNNVIAGTFGNGIFKTTNNGTNWINANNGLTNLFVASSYKLQNYLFIGTNGSSGPGVFASINSGSNWYPLNTGLTFTSVLSFTSISDSLYVGAYSSTGGVRFSSNYGLNWINISGDLPHNFIVYIVAFQNMLFAGTSSGIFKTTNNGINWISVNNSYDVSVMIFFNKALYVGTIDNGIYKSTNNGINWVSVNSGLSNLQIRNFAYNNSSLFVATAGGVSLSNNNGLNWQPINSGLTDLNIRTLFTTDSLIFAGTINGYVWKRLLSEVVNISNINNIVINKYSLSQNYPNPFNPTTKIRFDVPKSSFVNMVVYDVLGKEVAVLVNEELKAGEYSVDWSALGGAGNYTSGVYFYKFQAGEFVETKRMVLLK